MKRNNFFKSFLIYFTCLVFVFGLFYFNFFLLFDYSLQDKLAIKEEISDNIIIVKIDDESIQNYGEWPWNRKRHADLIEKLESSGVKVIAYDVTFSENGIGDEYFFETLKKYNNIIFPLEGDIEIKKNNIPVFKEILYPLDEIKDNFSVGFTTLIPDTDSKVRKTALFIDSEDGQKRFYPFFLYALEKIKYIDFEDLNNYEKYLNENYLLNIKFFGPRNTFINYSYIDVMSSNFNTKKLDNKIVLVGATARDLHDEYFTPSSVRSAISGVEIQANLIESFLQNNFITRISSKLFYFVLFIFLIYLARLVALRDKFIISFLLFLSLFLFYIFISIIIYSFGFLISIFYPILAIFVSYFVTYIKKYFQEKKEKQKIQSSFSQYVSKEVVDELMKNPEKLKLGGDKKKITILFSDIRGFTSFSEKMKPEDLVDYLNEYLNLMTKVIFKTKGVVDKFIGDAVMAFWGAPLKNDNQKNDAVFTALEMIDKLNKINKKYKNTSKPEIKIGIGINTGEVIVGNLGSDQRFDYTVIGDDVNLASRIESLTKFYGVNILISEKTKKDLDKKFFIRYIDNVAVKGKKQGVKIYEVLGYKKDLDKNKIKKYFYDFQKAVNFYLSQDWEKSEEIFNKLYKEKKEYIIKIYLDRIKMYKKNPPQNWDGVFRADFK